MKLSTFVQAVVFMILLAIAASSCKTSRQAPRENPPVVVKSEKLPPGQAKKVYGDKSAKEYAPGQQKKQVNSRKYPLIIIRTPDIVIKKHNDGRFYYQNPEGYYYWQGSDDRFYLDETDLSKVDFDDDQYKDWKNKGNGNGNSDKKENGNNGNGKGNTNKDQKKNKG